MGIFSEDENRDRYAKLIVVDFDKRKIDLTLEYQIRWEELEILKDKFIEQLKLIEKISKSNVYTNSCAVLMRNITRELEERAKRDLHSHL